MLVIIGKEGSVVINDGKNTTTVIDESGKVYKLGDVIMRSITEYARAEQRKLRNILASSATPSYDHTTTITDGHATKRITTTASERHIAEEI